jgi:hypothetical protein
MFPGNAATLGALAIPVKTRDLGTQTDIICKIRSISGYGLFAANRYHLNIMD